MPEMANALGNDRRWQDLFEAIAERCSGRDTELARAVLGHHRYPARRVLREHTRESKRRADRSLKQLRTASRRAATIVDLDCAEYSGPATTFHKWLGHDDRSTRVVGCASRAS